jgi:DAK2 domain fusion protein YloV
MPDVTAVLGAADLRGAILAALGALRDARAAIDAANVFPVPDADTGTNMVATFEAVAAALAAAPPGDDKKDDEKIARAIVEGSLSGARGNSGVIAAQVLRAWAEAVANGPADVAAVGRAFARATELAYEAVLHPAEGTMLSVVRAAADAAETPHADIAELFAAAARAADAELALSPQRMAVLARAGVVDAGGMGIVEILYAMARALGARVDHAGPVARAVDCERAEPSFRWEVQYLLRAPDARIPELRRALGDTGDSVAVIGGDGEWRVHVHTDDRDAALALGADAGEVRAVEIVDLVAQVAEEAAHGIDLARASETATLVAYAPTDELARLFAGLGAVVATDARALNEAVASARTTHVVVLPNDPELARAVAARRNGTTVTVLDANDPARGLAAAAAYGDARAAGDALGEMREALARARSAATDDPAEVRALVERLATPDAELVTVLRGDGDAPGELAAALRAEFPSLAVEVHDAGAIRPRFWVSVE